MSGHQQSAIFTRDYSNVDDWTLILDILRFAPGDHTVILGYKQSLSTDFQIKLSQLSI